MRLPVCSLSVPSFLQTKWIPLPSLKFLFNHWKIEMAGVFVESVGWISLNSFVDVPRSVNAPESRATFSSGSEHSKTQAVKFSLTLKQSASFLHTVILMQQRRNNHLRCTISSTTQSVPSQHFSANSQRLHRTNETHNNIQTKIFVFIIHDSKSNIYSTTT